MFSFTDIPAGRYKLLIKYIAPNGAEKTKTQMLNVTKNEQISVSIPDKSVSSIIEADNSMGDVLVDELDNVISDLTKNNTANEDITVKVTFESQKEDKNNVKQNEIRKLSGNSSMEYIDVKLTKTTGTGAEEIVSKTDKKVKLLIPYENNNKNIKLYRYDAEADGTTKAVEISGDKTADEYFELTSDGYIEINTNQFTTYAIGYEKTAGTSTSGGSSGGGSGSGSDSTPTPTTTDNTTGENTGNQSTGNNNGEKTDDWWFTDVPENSWFYNSVKYTYNNGLMYGVTKDTFEPETDVTRAMFVTVLYRMEGEQEAELDYTFNDIEQGGYYEKAVAWGSANGIIAGYSADKFAPNDTITREQMAAILWRYAKYKGEDVSTNDASLSDFMDTGSITEYAVPALAWICNSGIMNGFEDSTIRPLNNATRAQTAAMLGKFDDIFNK